jgi:ADP-ribose pyrophosphatase YjhB (NUDIX family)
VLSMWQSLVGAGVLVVKDGRVLMILRERSGETRWELPSGLAEHGESLEQTAIRETLEEVGVPVAIERLLCTAVMDVPDEAYRGINAYFCATALDDTAPTPSDGSEPIHKAEYVDLARLRPKQIHPVDRRILNLWKRKPDRPPFYVHITL